MKTLFAFALALAGVTFAVASAIHAGAPTDLAVYQILGVAFGLVALQGLAPRVRARLRGDKK